MNNVPYDLATMNALLLADGFELSGGTYTHPAKPALRLNVAYTYREATLTVTRRYPHERTWEIIGQYRGEHPLT